MIVFFPASGSARSPQNIFDRSFHDEGIMSNVMLCRHGQVRNVVIMKIIRTSAARVVSSGGLSSGSYMTPHEVHLAQPAPRLPAYHDALSKARHRVIATDQWTASQLMGRRWPIGCVALEITQRCNLDCTACYLSEHSEAVKDVPLEELFRRIDLIFDHYGPNVQVTGGDPTLRNREELVAIVRRLSQRGLRPALFTNGIRAKRELLVELVEARLVDVAFHVDLTQERRGYESEVALNEIRQDYIERARGLPLSVMFNTTIFDRNFEEIPAIVRFLIRNCDVVRLASFQLQAETGRGTLGRRNAAITVESVQKQIEKGARSPISFEALRVGHARCNRYGMIFVANNRAYDALDDRRSLDAVLERMPLLSFDRRSRSKVIAAFVKGILTSPYLSFKAVGWLIRKAWRAKSDLRAARGRVNKLSFVIHNFMDACRLERDRVDACAFMAMTQRGPLSMCLHNAKRDAFILAPIRLSAPEGHRFWNPISGELMEKPAGMHRPPDPNRKIAKGRLKRAVSAADAAIAG
jgi:tetraether lipid synthase